LAIYALIFHPRSSLPWLLPSSLCPSLLLLLRNLGMTWKFVILQTVVGHPSSKEILGLQKYYECLEYVKRGIHFKKGEAVPTLKDETC
jgi:hypothetical protein